MGSKYLPPFCGQLLRSRWHPTQKRQRVNESEAGQPAATESSAVVHKQGSPYPVELKRFVVEAVTMGFLTVDQSAQIPSSPCRSTIYQWLAEDQEKRDDEEHIENRGAPPKLTREQLYVVAGFVLDNATKHHLCAGEHVTGFISIAYREEVSRSYVSRHLHQLGFSSHRAKSEPSHYRFVDSTHAAVTFLKLHQQTFKTVGAEYVVAMDEISIWDKCIVPYTYSVIDG